MTGPENDADDARGEAQGRIEELIQRGELREALAETLVLLAAPEPDPGASILAAILQCQLCQFDVALGTLEALAARRPEWRTLAQEISLCVVGDRIRTERLHDAEIAAQRAGIAPPPQFARSWLEAAAHHASGDHVETVRLLEQARREAPPVVGRVVRTNGAVLPFDDLCDSDALTGPMLQGIGSRGLLDIPFSELTSVVFRLPRTYHDLLWPVAELETADGHRIVVRVPALYAETGLDESAAVRNGSMTTWSREHGYAIAVGQRDLRLSNLREETAVTVGLRQIARIDFTRPARD